MVSYASSLDTAGVFARSVADAAALLDAISGHDPLDSTSLGLPPTRALEALRVAGQQRSGAGQSSSSSSSSSSSVVEKPLQGVRVGVPLARIEWGDGGPLFFFMLSPIGQHLIGLSIGTACRACASIAVFVVPDDSWRSFWG